jgi:hypothetical protein
MHISDAVQLGKDSAYAKEITKHEAHHTQYGPPGRPYEYRPYPTMMYRASRPKEGGEIPNFDQMEAANDHERESCEQQGFVHGGKAAALAALERQEFEIAELAANRAANDRAMSERARAEAARVEDAAGIQHVASIGEANKKTGRRD